MVSLNASTGQVYPGRLICIWDSVFDQSEKTGK
jgi:hypothetical protein